MCPEDQFGTSQETVYIELEGASYVLKGANREKPFTIQEKA